MGVWHSPLPCQYSKFPSPRRLTLRKSNIAMENGPFEDVFPIKNGGYSIAMLVYQGVPPKKSQQVLFFPNDEAVTTKMQPFAKENHRATRNFEICNTFQRFFYESFGHKQLQSLLKDDTPLFPDL